MPNLVARSEQSKLPQSVLALVRAALRDAALAPTDCDSLNLAGAALLAIAELARAEVRHG